MSDSESIEMVDAGAVPVAEEQTDIQWLESQLLPRPDVLRQVDLNNILNGAEANDVLLNSYIRVLHLRTRTSIMIMPTEYMNELRDNLVQSSFGMSKEPITASSLLGRTEIDVIEYLVIPVKVSVNHWALVVGSAEYNCLIWIDSALTDNNVHFFEQHVAPLIQGDWNLVRQQCQATRLRNISFQHVVAIGVLQQHDAKDSGFFVLAHIDKFRHDPDRYINDLSDEGELIREVKYDMPIELYQRRKVYCELIRDVQPLFWTEILLDLRARQASVLSRDIKTNTEAGLGALERLHKAKYPGKTEFGESLPVDAEECRKADSDLQDIAAKRRVLLESVGDLKRIVSGLQEGADELYDRVVAVPDLAQSLGL